MGCLMVARPLRSIVLFNDFSLSPSLLKAVATLGYTEPTPIQERAIPVVLEGRDLMAAAQTAGADTGADARARRAGQRRLSRAGAKSADPRCTDLRRRQRQAAARLA